MGKSKRSLGGHLTLTAWESWSAEPHWRTAVIVMIVGTIAFSVSSPKTGTTSSQSQPAPSSVQQNTNAPMSMQNGNATLIQPQPKAPTKIKPKIKSDDVIIKKTDKKTESKNNDFGRSHGEK